MVTTIRTSSKTTGGKDRKSRQEGGGALNSAIPNDAKWFLQTRRASILLKQISDPTRLQILLVLAQREEHVGALCMRAGWSRPAVSPHLALLRLAGIIAPQRRGTHNYYSLTEVGHTLSRAIRRLLKESTANKTANPKHTLSETNSAGSAMRSIHQQIVAAQGVENVQTTLSDSPVQEFSNDMSHRRAELIAKKNRGHLNAAESTELANLQGISLAAMQREFPDPTVFDDRLKAIRKRLKVKGIEN